MNKKEFKTPRYNKVNPFVIIKGGAIKFIDFVEKVFDAEENKLMRTLDRDGTLIHAEIQIGDSMILLADSKEDWPFTPSFLQVYVDNAQETLSKAEKEGAQVITNINVFYNGLKLARFKDEWGNLWWLYEKMSNKSLIENKSDTDWHNKKASDIYTTLMQAMKNLRQD